MYVRVCSSCSKEFPLTSEHFHKQNTNPEGFTTACKSCTSDRKRAKRLLRQEQVFSIVGGPVNGGKVCYDCGMEHDSYGFFDFHHKDNSIEKKGTVSRMMSSASFERVMEEASKCVILCPNCHRNRHLSFGHFADW